jgi:4-hydroxy-2-oxoheptanedioate aldolase
MRKNKLKQMFKDNKPVINGWLQIPHSFSAEVMAKQGWDSLTIDLQHGVVDYPSALQMFQAISTTETVPMARVNWNEPGQIMKILDAGCYGIICPMVSNKEEAEKFVQACLYPPKGYRSFGPIRGLLYGGPDYGEHANDEILKLAMIETKESLNNLDKIMTTKNLDGIYIGPADLSLAIGVKPGFDNPEGSPTYEALINILSHAKKNNIVAGIHNATPMYAEKMIKLGFQFVTVGSDQKFMASGANQTVKYMKKTNKSNEPNGY